MKKRLTFTVVVLCWIFSCIGCEKIDTLMGPGSTDTDNTVTFPDINLGKNVRQELNIHPDAPVTKTMLKTLTILQILLPQDATADEMITDLTGLEHATQLSTLRLRNHKISDISLLADLKDMDYLDLDSNMISDISPLIELNKLRYLYLRNNKINDISLLEGFSQLIDLALNENNISDIRPLAKLTQLKNLAHVKDMCDFV